MQEPASTYDLPIRAGYTTCGGEGTLPGQGARPSCVDGQPPLPPGKYRLTLYEDPQNPPVLRVPAPIDVRVVRAKS